MLNAVGLSLIGVFASYWAVGGVRQWAERLRFLDIPNERSSHSRATPRGGGLAIVGVSLIGGSLLWMVTPGWPLARFLGVSLGGVLVAGVSWLDDVRTLPNSVKLAVHSVAAALAIAAVGFWQVAQLPLVGSVSLGWAGLPLTFLWIVGLTNAYNFMDGIDGIAGGQAVVAGLSWGGLGWLSGQPFLAGWGLLLAASSLGFLGHNWPPARIFMGDVGSAFLGFMFALFAVAAADAGPIFAFAGALPLWPFIFDTAFTFLRRLRRGENVFSAHRSHLYQRLVIAGLSHRTVTILYVGLAVVGGVLAVTVVRSWAVGGSATLVVLPAAALSLWAGVLWRERKASAARGGAPERAR